MKTNDRPIIFLAFANDYEGGYGYLPELASERRNLQAVLDRAQQEGLCEVVLRSDATLDDLVGVFQDARYRGRIAIFHFGGHAGAYELLLQTADGKHATAYADGLAAFLGRQPNLQLVFLNGCSTQPHVAGLHDAGIPVVIATHAEIGDQLAGDIALRFYQGLATGATIESAYHTAEAACRAATTEVGEFLEAGYLPWELSVRPGAEAVSGWSLPEAAGDPLFGLPPLPTGDLPAHPFRNILWFRREDAPLFFGRGYAIRELYQRVTAPGAAPIVLYYGQSGVGKSSLLAAGLLPRLEQMHTVVYTRRDQALRLAGTLAVSLLAAHKPGSAEDSGFASGAELLDRWRAIEAETGKPLTVIVDQVEEVYTRPNEALPDEMGVFLTALVAIFADPVTRPQGRLILSFRKEWLAEIEKLVADRHLPRARVFLQRLDRRGIIEAVTGPARSERLRQHFGLRIEDGLAAEIADDLLADPSSAVAPTLQILLSKLWDQAKARDYDHPHFDRTLYHDLRRKGLLLGDFLDQQLAALRTQQPASVDSGLALDLLAFHTTPLGTAEQRTLAEMRDTYAHQSMTVASLLVACRDLFLLVDPAENRPGAKHEITRLAHDTLAPLVRHRFEVSDAPGQRARRILESRAVDWGEGKEGTPLDEADLAIVETGKPGMRGWQPDEERLIQASYSVHAQRQAERERIQQERTEAKQREQVEREARAAADARADQEQKNAGKLRRRAVALALALGSALVLAGAASVLFYDAFLARLEAEQARNTLQTLRLAAVSDTERAISPQRGLLLALSATSFPDPFTGQSPPETEKALRSQFNEWQYWHASLPGHDKGARDVVFSSDGTSLYSVGLDGDVLGWDVDAPNHPPILLVENSDAMDAVSIHPDGDWLAVGQENGKIAAISTTAPYNTLALWQAHEPQSRVFHLASSANGQWLFSSGADGYIKAWSADPLDTTPLYTLTVSSDVACTLECWVRTFAVSADGQWLAASGRDKWLYVWRIAENPPALIGKYQQSGMVRAVSINSDGRLIGAADEGGKVSLYALPEEGEDETIQLIRALAPDKMGLLYSLAFHPTLPLIALGDDAGTITILPIDDSGDPLRAIGKVDAPIEAIEFSPDGELLATAIADNKTTDASDGFVALWRTTPSNGEPKVGWSHTAQVRSVVAFPDSEDAPAHSTASFITGSEDGTVRFWSDGQSLLSTGVITELDNQILAVAVNQDGRKLATAGRDGKVRLYEMSDSVGQPTIVGEHTEGAEVFAVAFSPDGEWLASGGSDSKIILWPLNSVGRPPLTLGNGSYWILALAFSNDSKFLASGDDAGRVRLWNLTSKSPSAETLCRHNDWVWDVEFSPDQQYVASIGADSMIRLSATANGLQPVGPIFAHERRGRALAYDPTGAMLASVGDDGVVRLWRSADLTARPVELIGHVGIVRDVAFSTNGHFLVTVGDDTTLRVWTVHLDDLRIMACQRAARALGTEEHQRFLPFLPDDYQPCPRLHS